MAFTNRAIMVLVVMICVVFCGKPTWGQSITTVWNQFRGPNGSGVAPEASLPLDFGPNKNVVWKTDLSKGYSSPVILDGRIYVTAEDNDDLFTICLNESDGKERWRKKAPRPRVEKMDARNHAASASPVVDGNRVFVFFPDFGMLAYSTDGKEIWRQPLGPFSNIYGMGASPITVGELVVLVCDQNLDSFIVAFDQDTGEIVWKTKRDVATSGHCTPILYRPDGDGDIQILVAGSFNFTSYDSTTGKKLWWVSGLCFEMKATPVIRDGIAFINGFGSPQNQPDQNFDIAKFDDVVAKQDADSDGALSIKEMPDDLAQGFFSAVDLDANGTLNEKEWNYFRASIASKNSMMAIRLGGSGDMTQQNTHWKYHKNIPQLPSPVLVGHQLIMISDRGIVTSLDPDTGQPQYRSRIPGAGGSYYASPVACGDKILFANTAGKLAIIGTGDELEVLTVIDIGEPIFATPSIVGNRIFVRTNKSLYCFGKTLKHPNSIKPN